MCALFKMNYKTDIKIAVFSSLKVRLRTIIRATEVCNCVRLHPGHPTNCIQELARAAF